ncbi:DUF6665 family protein [Phenylobacterium sp.]|uniref:DUF6665 family protein n=1 Tax=Phenylobacterium sp. TaxID=1871053 RepID=UPI002869F0BF|nr:DUF6665 family protein [Phenylobacterium sp.]
MSTFRLPQGQRFALETGAESIEAEIMAEKGAALGRAGHRVEVTLAALKAFDAGEAVGVERSSLVKDAATAVWYYFIQREACGIRDQKPAIAHYAIPREVLMRLGAR